MQLAPGQRFVTITQELGLGKVKDVRLLISAALSHTIIELWDQFFGAAKAGAYNLVMGYSYQRILYGAILIV